MEICAKCGQEAPGEEPLSYARSREWFFPELWQRESELDRELKQKVILCNFCRRKLESILYNWFSELPLNHNPFMM